MRSFFSVARSGVRDSVDLAVDAYHARFGTGEQSLEQSFQEIGSSESSVSILAALVKTDLQRRFGLGERPRAADYFEKFPILAQSSDRVVSLVYEEFCLLQECGENPDSQEFCEGYGPWRDSLFSQLAYHRELSRAVGLENPSVKFPSPGDQFDKYQLDSLLGKGGVAQVYLATEDDLGGRKLVIKVSASFGQEPSILAKLDHRNIVPILTVARSESGLRGICMPYWPGVTLEELIRRIGRGKPPRSARALFDALKPSDSPEKVQDDELRMGWEKFPVSRSYSEAVAWIGLELTNALTYLHGRDVFHRDIKPANVLLAYREGPKLLDFNLAQDPASPENANAALKGGTLPYMAPEHLRAFLDPSGWEKVNASADLYSLGLVLKELVTGEPPDLPSVESSLPRGIQSLLDRRCASLAPIREINPALPPSFVSIIEKCLAVDPTDRYGSASALGEDLKHFLARKPLKHAPNPSRLELASNWFHRNRTLSAGLISIVLVLLLIYVFQPLSMRTRIDRGEVLMDSSRPEDRLRASRIFEELHTEYPNSAWPLLYLSLTLDKVGGKNTGSAYELIQKACKWDDVVDAMSNRLKKEPRSVHLLTNLGIVLAKKGDYTRSREFLRRSLQVDANNFVTLMTLAGVDRDEQNYEQAGQLLSRAAQIGEAKKLGWDRLYQLHKSMLPIYLLLADRSLEHQPTERELAREHLTRLNAALEAIQRDWKMMAKLVGNDDYNFRVNFYEGCLASSRAVLAAELPDRAQATGFFEEARHKFDLAKETLSTNLGDDKLLRTKLAEQELKLKERLDLFAHRSKVVPSALKDVK